MTIWGNHSSTQYPDFYNTTIKGERVIDMISDEDWLRSEFIATVQQRGAAIIKARGASSAASAANAVIRSVQALTTDTDHFSVAKCSQGEYGIEQGLMFSFPCRTVNGELQVIDGLGHNEFAKDKLNATIDELTSERDCVREAGLIK